MIDITKSCICDACQTTDRNKNTYTIQFHRTKKTITLCADCLCDLRDQIDTVWIEDCLSAPKPPENRFSCFSLRETINRDDGILRLLFSGTTPMTTEEKRLYYACTDRTITDEYNDFHIRPETPSHLSLTVDMDQLTGERDNPRIAVTIETDSGSMDLNVWHITDVKLQAELFLWLRDYLHDHPIDQPGLLPNIADGDENKMTP